jgi:hypothetical protein
MRQVAAGALVILLAALGGCATTVTWRQREGLDYFVGRSNQALLSSLGTPTRAWPLKGSQYIAYDYDRNVWVAGEPGARDPNSGAPLGPWVEHRKCSTVFKLQGDQVIAWSLEGNACRDTPFPNLTPFSSTQIAKAAITGIQSVTQFPDDPFTGSSTVATGAFYNK